MTNLTKSQREMLIEKLTNLIDNNSTNWKLIKDTSNDKNLPIDAKKSMVDLWHLDINLNEIQIDEIKKILIENKFNN